MAGGHTSIRGGTEIKLPLGLLKEKGIHIQGKGHSHSVRRGLAGRSKKAQAVDWAAEHPDQAGKLIADIEEARRQSGGCGSLAGLRPRHALYKDHDIKFWLDVLVRKGKLKPSPGQLARD
jgi:hypothetical protein